MLCEAFKWNYLPMAGGLYDQNPDLLDHFYYIFAARSKYEAEESRKKERSTMGGHRMPSSRGRGR